MPASPDEKTRRGVESWKNRAEALERIREQELRALTEQEAGRLLEEMTFDPDTVWLSPERAGSAGLIEQQRLFMLSHEHPARHRRRP